MWCKIKWNFLLKKIMYTFNLLSAVLSQRTMAPLPSTSYHYPCTKRGKWNKKLQLGCEMGIIWEN